MGPALLLEGVIATVTLGTLSFGAPLEVSRRLALARFRATIREVRVKYEA